MIVNNTQANIFKVNGGLADNFVNRPAASGSFYIFYSIDTQEIYYDNGAWVLIGSSAGGGVNIYNNNGTLTGNRTLSGANNDLNFADLNIFKTSVGGNDIGLKLDFANQQYILGDINVPSFISVDSINGVDTISNTTINFIVNNLGNLTQFNVYDNLIKSSIQGNDIGLKLDFANDTYFLTNNDFGLNVDRANLIIKIGEYLGNANGTSFFIDEVNAKIYTKYYDFNTSTFNEIGLKLDFANTIYSLGLFNAYGYSLDPFNGFLMGDINGTFLGNACYITINNQIIKTKGLIDQGFYLDFANKIYQLGQITGGNQSLIEIDDIRPRIGTKFFGSSFNDGFDIVGNEYVRLGFNSSINKVQMLLSETGNEIQTSDINGTNGFMLDFNNQNFKFGYFVIPTNLWFEVDNTTKIIKTINNQNNNGLKLDFANTVYQFGQITGGNQTYLTIDDAAAYPVQLDGTNITSGTSGGVSGQHLKIKLNGVDYKIELRNP